MVLSFLTCFFLLFYEFFVVLQRDLETNMLKLKNKDRKMEKLTNQEEEIMLRIWQLGRCAVKQIMELLPEPRPPYTTVDSIVNNLKRKEYVKAKRDGKGYVYSPAIAESDYKRKFLSGFVNNYFRNSFKEMVSFFAKDEKISPEDLKDIIREIESSEE